MWLLYPFHRLLRKRRIPVSRALFSVPLGSLPLSRPLNSRYPPSRSPFHECSPRSKRSFRQSSSLPAGCCCIDESLRESRGNWMTATRREVSIRWFNQLARDASPSLSPILPSFLSFFCFWMAASAVCDWAHQFDSRQVKWDPITRFSCSTFFCCVNYRVGQLFERIFLERNDSRFEAMVSTSFRFLSLLFPISCNIFLFFVPLRVCFSSCFYFVSLSLSFYFLIYPHLFPPSSSRHKPIETQYALLRRLEFTVWIVIRWINRS